jgi:hypothetical protein
MMRIMHIIKKAGMMPDCDVLMHDVYAGSLICIRASLEFVRDDAESLPTGS